MLVLTRKPQQKLQIGENITVNVIRVRGNTVQLGIEAPRDIRVMRSELLDRSRDSDSLQEPAGGGESGDKDGDDHLPQPGSMKEAGQATLLLTAI